MKKENQRLAEFSDEVRQAILERLRGVPEGKENWRLRPDDLSFSDIVQHLLDADQWLIRMVEKREYYSMDPNPNCRVVKGRGEYEALLKELEVSKTLKRKFIQSLAEEKLDEVIEGPKFGKTNVWRAIVQGNLEHETHHRGQIEVYLQMIQEK